MTQFQNKTFSVAMPASDQYRDNWDAVFGSKPEEPPPTEPEPVAFVTNYEAIAAEFGQEIADAMYREAYFTVDPEDPKSVLVHTKDTPANEFYRVAECIDETIAGIIARTLDNTLDVRSDIRKQVEEFHRAMGQPVLATPTVPDRDRLKLRLNLIAEEFEELLQACGAAAFAYADDDDEYFADAVRRGIRDGVFREDVNLVAVADALADLDYVIEGMRLELGINGKPVADEVHRSNMSKLGPDGKPVVREDGKVIKPETYSPPDIEGELKKQGWTP